jgi:sugar lactone lactonase YvrE
MKSKWFVSLAFAIVLVLALLPAWADHDDDQKFPRNATFTTLITTPRAIEGLTGDNHRNLYTGGSGAPSPDGCPVWRINLNNPVLVPVGLIQPAAGNCGFSGIAFNELGDLFVADGAAATIYTFRPSANIPLPNATVFASGVPGANGLAFDKKGNLWASDGTTGRGRVWKITGPGANCTSTPAINCVEVFRIQPMANEVNLIDTDPDLPIVLVGGVGRDIRALPPGTITVTPTTRNAANTAGSQPLVANGLAFNKKGDLFNIDTARGALWKVEFDRHGKLKSPTGCDTTFTRNTLCLSNIFVAHPILEGGDGIALDREGNIWVDANERNAVAVVTKDGKVIEIFRTPVNLPPKPVVFGVGLRNAGDQSVGNNRILEFPTSPFITGKVFCTSQSDGDRRDNSPRSAGEIDASGGTPTKNLGKISCMDQELKIPGLPLPID